MALLKADCDVVEHVSNCTAVHSAVMALIKPVRDHQADILYKNTARRRAT
jgi:hypothetical protein